MERNQIITEEILKPRASRLSFKKILVAGIVLFAYWQSLQGTNFNVAELIRGAPAISSLLREMFPPDWSYLTKLGQPVIETLQIGIVASAMAAILSVPLAFLGAKNVSPHPAIYYVARFVLTICRGVSEIIWALLIVVAVGLGPFAGVIALIIFGVGMVGKLVADALESVDPGPLEAMSAAGASRWKVFLYGAWPQVLPLYLTYCLYCWDHNTRAAVVIGFVGAGGVGYSLFFNMSMYDFEKAMMAMIVLILMIVVIDRFCLYLRRKII